MLREVIDWLVYTIGGLDPSTALGEAVHFFVYDTIKIFLLLFFMISAIGVLRSYLPLSKLQRLSERKGKIPGHIMASVAGVLTPFCSCSSIPIFISFVKSRLPVGIALSFLITSPLVNEYLVVLMLGYFGIWVTGAYVLVGLLVGIIGGMLIGSMRPDSLIEEDMRVTEPKEEHFSGFRARLRFGVDEAKDVIRKLWPWVTGAIALGAIIHSYVPESLITSIGNSAGPLSIPVAALAGIPLYANCAAILPIAFVLFQKGLSLGTALAFMMAVSALSLPEAIMLRRAMKLKLIAIFFGTVAVSIVIVGYLFNLLMPFIPAVG